MNVAVLGGSFNPVHYGHLALAETVLRTLDYDVVVFVPTNQSPFKTSPEGATSRDRVDMLMAAISGNPRFMVDDCEIKRGGLSYTIDTILDIERRYQCEKKIGLLLGDDHLGAFHRWKSADLLAQKADLLLATRINTEINDFPYPYRAISNPQIPISSSQVRSAIREGAAWTHLVPPGVAHIIRDRGLYAPEYGGSSSVSASLIALIEDLARAWLPQNRFLHSKNVAVLSAQLCRRYGMDEKQGYLAGIAHDMCKAWTPDAIMKLASLDGLPINSVEHNKPELMHGRAAAVYLQAYHGLENQSLLQALRMHTFGGPAMEPLAKIVYIADKIEPLRMGIEPSLRIACRTDSLPVLFAKVVSQTLLYLKQRVKLLTEESEAMLAELRQEGLL